MYGGSSSKLNRPNASSRLSLGGSGGNQKRFHGGPPPPPPPSSSRVQGGPPNPGGGGGVDETFNLASGKDAVAFASIIRLTPDLIEEIKRLEGQGGKARIKFDPNGNNTSGNVIEAGGREYRFTWSREFGELCDIYEERKSGKDGTGLLVESGSAWRKINVQRVLDESTKKHVKMRSEEAAKISKSRKAIVLEPGNPSMKSQIKQLAAVEVNHRRMHVLQKKEPPFKKQKVGSSSVSSNGPSKPTFKPGSSLPVKPFAKGSRRLSASPLPSPSHQSGAIVSPYKMESTSHINVAADDATRSHPVSKDGAATFQREPRKSVSGSQERLGPFDKYGDRPMDLQNSLIKLLTENPKGMSFEALENATGGTITGSGRKIGPILKKITTYQSPGRYLLKTGVELDSFQRPSPGSGSSLEDNQNLEPASELNVVKSLSTDGKIVEKIEVHASLAESNFSPGPYLDASENINIERNSPDNFGDKKESVNSEGQARSSSVSGSDSESESSSSDSRSDSGSPSGSRSRSRSQAGSGSSSDSDSDASPNSRKGSDVDVDIMTSDDEKVRKPKLHNSDPGFASPVVGIGHDSGGDEDLMSIVSEPAQPKRVELVGKLKEMGHDTVSLPGPSQKGHDGIATDKGPGWRGPIIQRELSDLELGELREPVLEVTAPSKQFERNRDSLKFDSGRAKPLGKASLNIQSMQVSSRKRPLEQRDDNRPLTHLASQSPSRLDSSEVNLPIKDLSKLTKNEVGAMIGLASEETGNNLKAPSVNGVHRFDPKRGLTSQIQKESRLQNCNNAAASFNGQKDLDSLALQRARESSSDNSSCSYTKFEKDKPELKGQIKDFSQYKEYIQEYKDKYESYRSLNKIIENYRNQFQKIGNDLQSARGRGDMERYNKILAHLRDSYWKCGSRHKRLKKIFVVLHEELEHLKRMIREFVATHSKD